VLVGVLLNPHVLEEAESSLVCIMLGMVCKEAVVHEGHRPEIWDSRHNLAALLVDGAQSGLGLTLYTTDCRATLDISSAFIYSIKLT